MYKQKGKVIAILPIESGTSQSSGKEWTRQSFVIQVDEVYTRNVVFQLIGKDRIEKADLRLGEEIEVKARLEGHCYKDRWYNDVQVYDIYRNGRSMIQGV